MLSRIRCNFTADTGNMIYKSFIIPVFDYCDTVWNCWGKENSELMDREKMRRRAARLIVRHTTCRSKEALTTLAYETIEARRQIYNVVIDLLVA